MHLSAMANAIRMLSAESVQRVESGHLGAVLGLADVATVLWAEFLKFDAKNPHWPDRDRFILSNGHASLLLYSLLYLCGFKDATLDDLKHFRQDGSKMGGHPEYGSLAGIDATTGALGQGLAMGVGMALAERKLKSRFGYDVVNHKTYVVVGDGDLMEGVAQEAIQLAGALRLSNLIVIWDSNNVTIDGVVANVSCTSQQKHFEANGWRVLECNGHHYSNIESAFRQTQHADRPTLMIFHTTIGLGIPKKAGKSSAHSGMLTEEELIGLRKSLDWKYAPFCVPRDTMTAWRTAGTRGEKDYLAWKERVEKSSQKDVFKRVLSGQLPDDLNDKIQKYKRSVIRKKPQESTRDSSGHFLEYIVPELPELLGGSADLSGSTKTKTPCEGVDFINYGVREHVMGAMMNGLALHGGFIPYGGTFLVFMDYMKPAIRFAAMMKQRVIYVFSHDSIGIGGDGPTHQPVEQLASLRTIPNLVTLRPCDALETVESWQLALASHHPTALILSRQALPFIRTSMQKNLTEKGAYVIYEVKKPSATILATGSEVSVAVIAARELKKEGVEINVVSMPSWELFAAQPEAYRKKVLGTAPRLSLEAGSTFGWERYANQSIGVDTFGASAPAYVLFKKAGITVGNVMSTIKDLIKKGK